MVLANVEINQWVKLAKATILGPSSNEMSLQSADLLRDPMLLSWEVSLQES